MSAKTLLVDDEVNILTEHQRRLRKDFTLDGERGQATTKSHAAFVAGF
jgi:hypothetical protein